MCCIESIAEARDAIGAGADAVGLVGAMPSGPGVITDDTAAQIAASVPPPVASFLLTSCTDAQEIAAHVAHVRPTSVQVVAHIDPSEYDRLSHLLPRSQVKRVQVIHIESAEAIGLIDHYAPHVDAFLLDSGRPSANVPELGGTGRVHDWDVSAGFVARSPRPVFLAGGLTPENVAHAIENVRPYGVDLCTGVRDNGRLDRERLRAFMTAVAVADRRIRDRV